MTDEQIRQAFENQYDTRETWGDRHAWDQSLLDFEAGYKAALASLEQVGYEILGEHSRSFHSNNDAEYFKRESLTRIPLYRIKEKS